MNLLETHLRAFIVNDVIAGAFERHGFKTETRRLKIQSREVLDLVGKALKEMPPLEPLESFLWMLGGKPSGSYAEKRRVRGRYYERIGKAEKIMLNTLRGAFDSLYKTHTEWSRREQIAATTRMMKGMIEEPKRRAKAMLAAAPK